jgi:importin subunit alpha-1
MEHSSARIREQACWAIGNIAGDSPALRDLVLETGAMPLILELCSSTRLGTCRIAVWTLSNLCRGTPAPARSEVCFPSVCAIAVLLEAL